jgi:uncharacterized membrane protein YbaN (DUF454 family)
MKNKFYTVLGMACVIFGIINWFIPGLPTTPFLILASMLFAKGSPKMRAWLLRSKFLGPYLDNYYNKRGMTMAYKLRTIAFMGAGMIFAITLIPLFWIQILVAAIGVAVSTHIFIAKSRPQDKAHKPLPYTAISLIMVWFWITLGLILNDTHFYNILLLGVGIALSVVIVLHAVIAEIRN